MCACTCCAGGHTSEILRLVGSLSASYTPRYYVVADTDRMSEEKITTFEHSKGDPKHQVQSFASWSLLFDSTFSKKKNVQVVMLRSFAKPIFCKSLVKTSK